MKHSMLFFFFLLYNVLLFVVQQSESAICIHISLFWISFQKKPTTKHCVQFLVLYSRFSLVTYFIHNVCVHIYIYIYMYIYIYIYVNCSVIFNCFQVKLNPAEYMNSHLLLPTFHISYLLTYTVLSRP